VSEPELTPEQLLDQIKKLKVSDLLLSTVTTLAQLGYAKLDEETRDLEQARLAIDALSALIPQLEPHIPGELSRDLNSMLANLQLAYAAAVPKPVE
jgi:hypothetical protein